MEYFLRYNKDGVLELSQDDKVISPAELLLSLNDRRRHNKVPLVLSTACAEVPRSETLSSGESCVFCLDGPMGVGKTTFTKLLCESMGSTDIVNSPTFAIVNVYEDRDGNEIYHFDCYRLNSIREAIDLGAEEYLYSGKYCFVEWAENIESLLPDDCVHIKFEIQEDGSRKLTF